MQRREFITVLGVAAGWPLTAPGQDRRLPIIGFLSSLSAGALSGPVSAFSKLCPVFGESLPFSTPRPRPNYGLYLQSINAGTSLLGTESIPIQVHSEADIENAIRKVGSEPDSGLFVLPDSHNRVHRKRIIELTADRSSRLFF